MKGTLLMANNKKLTTAKNKLREIFYVDFLAQSYSNLYLSLNQTASTSSWKGRTPTFSNLPSSSSRTTVRFTSRRSMKTTLRVRLSLLVESKFQSFFIDQDTALHSEDVLNLGQLELIQETYGLYLMFRHWIRHYGSQRSQIAEGLFVQKLSRIISDLFERVAPSFTSSWSRNTSW